MSESCLWCDSPATRYCDHVLGAERDENGLLSMAEVYTCDAPMCGEHAKRVGHVAGQKHHDTIDMCPEHECAGLTLSKDSPVRDAQSAELARREVRAKAARSRFALVRGR